MKGYSHGVWANPRTIVILKAMWDRGYSARQIAVEINHEFGSKITRNAVIGKANRLELPMRDRNTLMYVAPRAPRKPRLAKSHKSVDQEMRARAFDSGDNVIKLINLKNGLHECRWPLGDPMDSNFGFCGNATTGFEPYCEHHASLAYTAAGRARNRKPLLFTASKKVA